MGMNAQIPPAISCPGRMRNPGAFAAPLESPTFCRRNRKWKPQLLFWRGPISRRRASLAVAIFSRRRHNGKRGTLAERHVELRFICKFECENFGFDEWRFLWRAELQRR